ncbi:MAG: hypothetical protein ACJA1R_000662, partial [Flavobacteriales bacterium]
MSRRNSLSNGADHRRAPTLAGALLFVPPLFVALLAYASPTLAQSAAAVAQSDNINAETAG